MDDIFPQYYEDLLRAQYRVSENLVKDQHLACGTIREEFLREILIKKKRSIEITKGFIRRGNDKSGECDHIFHHQDSPVDTLGGQVFLKPEHCRLVLEIKSNATGTDIKKTNDKFKKIKSLDSDNQPVCGLFCYNTAIEKKTILNRFGWRYYEETESWEESISANIEYPYIDFIVCIACLEKNEECIKKQFFLIKDNVSGRFILCQEYPIIKNFFAVTDNL
ncbi:MAG: DUF6602 domain-containing protein [Candidatus Moraniibacteriota bacterium]